jgi:transcriptional regulator with XRE-family HTH domain
MTGLRAPQTLHIEGVWAHNAGVTMDFDQALAAAFRRIREKTGRRQEDVAAEARAYGLQWTSATVAAIETGRRHVSAVELLMLPWVLGEAGDPIELADLFAGAGRVQLTPEASVDGRVLAAAVTGRVREIGKLRAKSWAGSWNTPRRRASARALREEHELLKRAAVYDQSAADAWKAWEESGGEAERKAGYRFGCEPLDVALAARSLWGRSLSDERNARAQPGASPQARGRITRQLLDELERVLNKGGPRHGSRRTSK